MGICSGTKCHAGRENVTSTERQNPKTLTQGNSRGKQMNPIGPREPRWEGNIERMRRGARETQGLIGTKGA